MKRHRRYKNVLIYCPVKRGNAGIFPMIDLVEYPEVLAYVRRRGGGPIDRLSDCFIVPDVADKLYLTEL